MPKTLLLISIVIIVAVGLYLGFGNKLMGNSQKYSGPVEKVTLAASPVEALALIWIAENKKYFSDNGLDVTIVSPAVGTDAIKDMISGKVDVGVFGEFSAISNDFDKLDMRILSAIDSGDSNSVVVRKDRGILKPSDLKGKKIGVLRKNTPEFFLGKFLVFNDLKLSDVKIVDLKPADNVEAIVNGTVDAIMTYEPNVYKIKQRMGENVIIWPGQSGQRYYALLVSRPGFVKSHKSVVEKLLRSVVQAEKFVAENEAEAQKIIEQRFKYDHSYTLSVWPKHDFSVSLNQSLLLLMENELRWTIANKLTDKTVVPNYADFIYTDALRKVKLEAVTLY